MKPLIGITCSFDHKEGRYFLPDGYVEAILGAGGYPVLLPGSANLSTVEPYLKKIQGLLLSGGVDVDPYHFNEEPAPGLGEIVPERDAFEIMLVKAALKEHMPVLGICRGIQVMNIAYGGTIIQHIPARAEKSLKHAQSAPRYHSTHSITVAEGTKLYRLFGSGKVRVNSFHHQAVKKLAPGFKVSAKAPDGIIEAIESTKHKFVLGVQWHPECMITHDTNARVLFQAFVKAVIESAAGKKTIGKTPRK